MCIWSQTFNTSGVTIANVATRLGTNCPRIQVAMIYVARIFVKEPFVTFKSVPEIFLIIWVRLRPAATMYMDTIVITVLLPNVAIASFPSTQPVNTSSSKTIMDVKHIGILFVKNATAMNKKISRQIVICDIYIPPFVFVCYQLARSGFTSGGIGATYVCSPIRPLSSSFAFSRISGCSRTSITEPAIALPA